MQMEKTLGASGQYITVNHSNYKKGICYKLQMIGTYNWYNEDCRKPNRGFPIREKCAVPTQGTANV